MNTKKCNKCNEEKDVKLFTNGWATCRPCREIKRKEAIALEKKKKEDGIYFVHDDYYQAIWRDS